MRGRVLALQAIVFLGSTPIGGPILGVVSQELGPRAGIALGGIACLVAAAFGIVAMRRFSNVTSESSLAPPPTDGACARGDLNPHALAGTGT